MFPEICSFLGNTYVHRIENNTVEVSVYECVKEPAKKRYNFQQTRIYKKALSAERKYSLFGIYCVGIYETSLKAVISLLQDDSGRIYVLSCPEKISDSHLSVLMEFECELTDKPEQTLVLTVTDGPAVLLSHFQKFQVLSPVNKSSELHDLGTSVCKDASVSKILQFTNLFMPKDDLVLYFLAVLLDESCEEENVRNVHTMSLVHSLIQGKLEEQIFCIPNEFLFPQYYRNIICAMQSVFSFAGINSTALENVKKCSGKLNWRENHTVICTNKQFLIFHRGYLKHLCSIPFSDIGKILELPGSRAPADESEVLLQSSSSGICYLAAKRGKSFQCIEEWKEVAYVLPGDFCKNGSGQVLLLLDAKHDTWRDGCRLQQLSSLGIVTSPNENEIPDDHLRTTIVGLQKRIMSGEAAIVDSQYKIAQKAAAISEQLKYIESFSSKDIPLQHNKSLVDIILHKEECQKNQHEVHDAKLQSLKVVGKWSTLLLDHWVIGWTLYNMCESCIKNITGTLVAEDIKLEYKVKVFIHDSPDFYLSRANKEHANPGEMFSVITCLQLPMVVADSLEVTCIVSWNAGVYDELHGEFFTERQAFINKQLPLLASLPVERIFQKEAFTECTEVQQLMSFRAFQEDILFQISTKTSELSAFESFLQQKSEHVPEVNEHNGTKWLIFRNTCPLYGVNMIWSHLDTTTIEACAYFRNEQEAVLLVHWLYSVLPVDATVLPRTHTPGEEAQLKRQLLVRMKDEVDLIRSFLTLKPNMPLELESTSNEEIADTSVARNIHLSKEAFMRMRKSLTQREYATDNVAKNMLK